jgi:hypothetical protein
MSRVDAAGMSKTDWTSDQAWRALHLADGGLFEPETERAVREYACRVLAATENVGAKR